MKNIFKKIIVLYLFYITRIVIYFKKPIIILILGSRNKSMTKNAIAKALEHDGAVRINPRSWNAEIGLPLSILAVFLDRYDIIGWTGAVLKAAKSVFIGQFPRYIVLEASFNKPGDTIYLFQMLHPKIVVITNSDTVYMENFNSDIEQVHKEYLNIMNRLSEKDMVILNATDILTKKIKESTKAHIITYALEEGGNTAWGIKHVVEQRGKQTFEIYTPTTVKRIDIPVPGSAARQAQLIASIVSVTTK